MHDVAVLHHVLLAFLTQLAGVAAAQLATQLHVVGIGSGFRLDEAALEIGVDDAGGLRSLRADGDGPSARFRFTAGDIALLAQQLVGAAHQAR